MDRKLASIQVVEALDSIEGADKIVLAHVLGWKCVVGKDDFKVGDRVVYFEVDSVLPERAPYEFLRDRCWVDNGAVRGFRIRTIKLRGQVSQGLLMPLSAIPELKNKRSAKPGLDVTALLDVVKYERPEPQQNPSTPKNALKKKTRMAVYRLIQKVFGWADIDYRFFPSWVPQTDEVRLQSAPELLSAVKTIDGGARYYITEKVDGMSGTAAMNGGVYYVMSRTLIRHTSVPGIRGWLLNFLGLDLKEENAWTNAFAKYGVEPRLREYYRLYGKNLAIQAEILGPSIQSNKYKLKENVLKVFYIYDVDRRCYLSLREMLDVLDELNRYFAEQYPPIHMVPIVEGDMGLDNFAEKYRDSTVDDFVEMAKGNSQVCLTALREGIVIRTSPLAGGPCGDLEKISFKVINNDFLLKYKED